MVDALVGILILVLVAASVSAAFGSLFRLDHWQDDRLDRLQASWDAVTHAPWL